jgi:hypothetical protein
MTDYGIKISNTGIDVHTGAIKDMVLHSEHFGLKIIAQGSKTFSVTTATGGSTSVAHGLSYTPAFLAYCNMTGSSKYYSANSYNIEGSYEQFIASSDSTNLYFSIDDNAGADYTATVYYFILADPGL